MSSRGILKAVDASHPLPGVNYISPDLDSDLRAAYFRIAEYGILFDGLAVHDRRSQPSYVNISTTDSCHVHVVCYRFSHSTYWYDMQSWFEDNQL